MRKEQGMLFMYCTDTI